ncbi:hypothetical protein [Streptomyces sp. NPDC005953]|uniref:hypothetical protein n=1 Tax=Streptomyces sp. NPDC005953 TaxID=3156719 RepID=UPI00340E9ABB
MARNLPEDKFQLISDLHEDGCGRNEIARRVGEAPVTVSRVAEHLGLTFDRTRIQAATAARLADLAERRALLAEQFHDVAEDSLKRIYVETTVYAFGGKDNSFASEVFPEAPHAERRALVSAAGMAVDRSLKLAPAAETSELDTAKSMLGSLNTLLKQAVATDDEQSEQQDGGEG